MPAPNREIQGYKGKASPKLNTFDRKSISRKRGEETLNQGYRRKKRVARESLFNEHGKQGERGR